MAVSVSGFSGAPDNSPVEPSSAFVGDVSVAARSLERRVHSFWMHNTCIPLDLLFLDEDGLVVGIVENAPTLNDDPRAVSCPSAYVLEVNAGWARRHGVRAGMRAVIPPRA